MRPLRLDMAGFTVFREPTTVDLTDADFFALVGPTGSGKSTVLDAICFALYGTVPRWNDRRSVANALAPSATEARVRLIFEAAGARFVAVRVVRRDGKGRVATSQAGLAQLPHGFDLRAFDSGLTERETLGTVLAGTPAEMDRAVEAAVGLPYDQFISCVLLPQGEFSRFLHAKRSDRQDILVKLLGLGVYEKVRARATAAQSRAEAAATAARGVLQDLGEADDAALDAAWGDLNAARALAARVEEALPPLTEALARAGDAEGALAERQAEIAVLGGVRPPVGVDALAARIAAARLAARDAQAAVTAAEEREEKLRAELATAGDRTVLQRLLDRHGERTRLTAQLAGMDDLVAEAEAVHGQAESALALAREQAVAAAAEVATAEHALDRARTADRAGTLRAHLVAGEACPVCERPVAAVPPMPAAEALAAAQAALSSARKVAEAAERTAAARDKRLRELDRDMAGLAGQREQTVTALAAAAEALVDAPGPGALRARVAAVDAADTAVRQAGRQLTTVRQHARAAVADAATVEQQLQVEWRRFDQVRDGLARFGPPAPDRDNLAGSWTAVSGWATGLLAERRGALAVAGREVELARAATAAARATLDMLFTDAGIESRGAYQQAAALAVQRAEAAVERVEERRAMVARYVEQVAGHERDVQVARALANHLKANNFERWLLEEALDTLVEGASEILRELSAGQYDLVQVDGEFFVVDHTDAGLRRAVRTLSGGETFQASLALALALSDQLTGMSTTSATLESIMLDEGFGTLDVATLDIVAATLERLAARGDRMVGVVTHVSALAERIPVRFEVSKDARGVARVERMD